MNEQRAPDRYSTVLGKRVAIMQPPGLPKRREECVPFTFELYDVSEVEVTNVPTPRRSTRLLHGADARAACLKAQERFMRGVERLEREAAKRGRATAKGHRARGAQRRPVGFTPGSAA